MSRFENVSVDCAANVYFDGKVTSRTIRFPSGEVKTLGIMLPGDYHFGTGKAELMEIQSGEVEVKLPGSDTWQTVGAGGDFSVPANSGFDIRVKSVTDYCCSFLES